MTFIAEDFPSAISASLRQVHPSWHAMILDGLNAVSQENSAYFDELCAQPFLPTQSRLFAAFERPLSEVRYILVGEGPYPREESATGVCFMDGAVKQIWSDNGSGLSKKVNRATSLRNFLKMLLVAAGELDQENTTGAAMSDVAKKATLPDSGRIQFLSELQANLQKQGFLLLNASLVYRDHVAPVKDGKAWRPFLSVLLTKIYTHHHTLGISIPSLILWGKIAEQLKTMPDANLYPQIVAEHPYNLSFIANKDMHRLFGNMKLLDSQ